jgi:hypothetical protein
VLPELKKLGLKEKDLITRKLVSPTKAIAMVPKEKRAKLEEIYVTKRDADRLVPESDPRQSFNVASYFDAEDDGQED